MKSLKDANLKLTLALPAGANTVYATPGIDTGKTTAQAVQDADVEFLLSAPALAVGQLANTATMKYTILHDTVDPIDGSSTVMYQDILTQTGAGGAGAGAATVRFKLPSDAKRILGMKIVNSDSNNASSVSSTLELLA